MKKALVLLLIVTVCITLAACGTEKINSYNYEDYLDVKIDYYIKNEGKSGSSRTADGEVFITVTPKDPENTTIDSISAKVSADSPWFLVSGSNVTFSGYNGAKWMAQVTLKADSPLVNTSLKLNAKYLDINLTVSGEYKK